ncbi:hypothetical protein [Streptomyces sp. UNOC14_S4]|uniref:hypothetical protein n=1 Tax=Streptomyces sp. UNOC14_S4 TaxID=2872340 RepID=UPI001E3C8444|nr:hypothetical protein [Streptomyces sp. UNOC14_S4]MCC3767844.1 hypothetical protein [Streptomyces sp. UNOC14_S4]
MPTPSRFRDPQYNKYYFAGAGTVLVRCPKCARQAQVVAATGDDRSRRLVCRHCGLSRQRKDGEPIVHRWYGDPDMADPYFHVPLWLQTHTRHGRLWAYSPEHLTVLRQYVAAALREHDPWHEHWRKMGMIGRLPAWIKHAKNRDEVLRGLDRMRASLVT